MNLELLEIKTALQIQKNVSEVYEALVDPDKMCQYFLAQSSGRIEEGAKCIWKFAEYPDEIHIRVGLVRPNAYISFYWIIEGFENFVEIFLTAKGEDTLVTITEKSRQKEEIGGIKWLKGNTEGWANFLACLKAYLEYGINLRKGAFAYVKEGQA